MRISGSRVAKGPGARYRKSKDQARKEVGDFLRVDYVLIVVDVVFFILAIFFSGFTVHVADLNLRIQLVALSSSFFVGGIVIVIALLLLYIFKQTLFKKR